MHGRIVMLIAATCVSLAAERSPTFEIHRPTVVAFFLPPTKKQLDNGSNEALADFVFYNNAIGKALDKEGVDFHVVYGKSFRIRVGTEVTTFHTAKLGVGYYFVAPGKKPRIEPGVLDYEAIDIAREYFGKTSK